MPRTKHTKQRATGEPAERYDMMMKTFDKHAQLCITKLERNAQADMKSFEAYIDVKVSCLPMEIRQMRLGEILVWQPESDCQKENCNEVSSSVTNMQPPTIVPKLRSRLTATKRATATSDDGYGSERGTSSVSNASRTAKMHSQTTMRKTRSSTRMNRPKLSEINETATIKPGGKDRLNVSSIQETVFKTPAMLKPVVSVYNLVTPKIKPNTPLNVLRRPRQGEMVLSMQGSPLLVSAVVEEKTANINVPLGNGNMMSLLPEKGLRMSNIPQLDPEMMQQLETLKNHIEKVIASK